MCSHRVKLGLALSIVVSLTACGGGGGSGGNSQTVFSVASSTPLVSSASSISQSSNTSSASSTQSSAGLTVSSGLTSYFNLDFDKALIPLDYEYGFSMYSAMWPMIDKPLKDFQTGFAGTWLNANNDDFFQSLLPANHPLAGSPYDPYSRLYQTLEGSGGYWISSRFPSNQPKYRINGTPNAYGDQLSAPGWEFGGNAIAPGTGGIWNMPMGSAGVAQLSNHLLVPPDGLTFKNGTNGELFGVAWMALPLTLAKSDATPVGNQSWTFFVNATNYQGPVVFFLPDVWTILSRTYPTANSRGLDARPALMPHFAMEFGSMPFFQAKDSAGNDYIRMPHMSFPIDDKSTTYLAADFTLYSKTAIFNPLMDWINGGTTINGSFSTAGALNPALQAETIYMWKGGTDIQMQSSAGLKDFIAPTVITTPQGKSAWAFQWKGASLNGVFPEYFKKQDTNYVPIQQADVPDETGLKTATFPAYSSTDLVGGAYVSPNSWHTPAPAAGPFTKTLVDGSKVTYYWYRFIDQPSLQGFSLTDAEKTRLQSIVEKLQVGWNSTSEFIAPPSVGNLATLDSALIVSPPTGLEVGYVPIVTGQSK